MIELNFNFNNNYEKRPLSAINEIILHHTGCTSATAEDINNWHKQRGYAGIGYHYYIRKNGSLYKGRSLEMVGAHAYGHNKNSIGICLEGNFESEFVTEEQKQTLVELIRTLKDKYKIDKISKHKDYNKTSCPR